MDYCEIIDIEESLIITKQDCLDNGGDWLNNDLAWDNMLMAIYNMYVVQCTDSWTSFMFDAQNTVKIDKNPQNNY